MSAIFTNLQSGQISDNPLTDVATTINSAAFANLPVVSAPDILWLVLDPEGADAGPEIVKVTAHSASATSVTVERQQQSTTGVEHPTGTVWVAALTKDDLDKGLLFRVLTTTGDIAYASAANTAARLAIGTAGLVLESDGTVPSWGQVGTAGIADDAVTLAKLADEVANRLTPAGTIRATLAATEDAGWVNHDQTVVDCETEYPALWAVAPASWQSGSDLVIPDLTDVVLAGAGTTTLGALGGANTKTIAEANLPAHTHTINHDHAATTSSTESLDHTHNVSLSTSTDGDHTHTPTSGVSLQSSQASSFNLAATGTASLGSTNLTTEGDHSHTVSGQTAGANSNHSHTVDLPAYTGASGSTGSGTALDVRNRHLAVNFQIKAH